MVHVQESHSFCRRGDGILLKHALSRKVNCGTQVSRVIEKRLTESRLTIERTAEILCEIKAIPVKSPVNMVYRSESDEAAGILNELGIKTPERILVGALPKSG